MKKKALVLSLLSCAMLANQSLYAGNRAGAVTFTPGVAYNFFAAKRQLDNTWLLPTLQLAYDFDDRWAIEGMYGNGNTRQTIDGVTNQVRVNLYTLDGLYRFAKLGMAEPYVSFGLGVYNINPNGTSATNQANINAGLGTQIFFHDSVALRGEVRDLYTMSGGKNDVTLGFGVSFLLDTCCKQQTAVGFKDAVK